MEKKYFFLKLARNAIAFSMILILLLFILYIYKEYANEANYYSMPIGIEWICLILYIPIIISGIWGAYKLKKELIKSFPEKYSTKGKIAKKATYKSVIKYLFSIILLISLILLFVPFIVIFIITNHHVNYKNNSLLQMTYKASDFNLDENVLTLVTEDNFNIWASEITVVRPKAIVIYLTGIEQPSITQFYAHAKLMKDNGYASILLEVRGHGYSDGNKNCLGYDENLDVKAALTYIKSKKEYVDIPVIIQGVSMGGAIATNAFGQYNEINALIAMSTYTTFEDAIMDNLKFYKIPNGVCNIVKPVFKLALKLRFGAVKVDKMNPINQIQKANNRPILFMASEGDTNVLPINTQYLYKVAKKESNNVDIWIRNSWEHFIVKDCKLNLVEEDKEYCNKILAFFNEVCNDYRK